MEGRDEYEETIYAKSTIISLYLFGCRRGRPSQVNIMLRNGAFEFEDILMLRNGAFVVIPSLSI